MPLGEEMTGMRNACASSVSSFFEKTVAPSMLTAPKVKRPVACEWIGSRAWKRTLGTSDVAEICPGIVRSMWSRMRS